ncbi:hypothetical protein NC651_027846 [Populus alba x Populus x berolinensis]|nr:hypothetical protein NC651_027846 [Populus alba x Populus x berolinensis]
MPTVCGGWTLLDRSEGVTEEEGKAVVELLEALSWAVVDKWVRLRVVMVIGSMHEGVKACLSWSLRWWWSRLSGSLVL